MRIVHCAQEGMMAIMEQVRHSCIFSWLHKEIQHIRRERKVDEIVNEVIKALKEANLDFGVAGVICAIGGYIHGNGKPVETRKVYEALSDEYKTKSVNVGIWAGRKAGIFQGGSKHGLIYFTEEFARLIGLPVYKLEDEPVRRKKRERRRKVMQTAAH